MSRIRWILLIAGLLSLSTCADRQAGEQNASITATQAVIPAPSVVPPGEAASPTVMSATGPTQTPTPTPFLSPTPSQEQAPTPLPTRTPAPTPLHPLAVESMRQQTYPGSEVTIVETLQPGANYHRYLATYRSDGCKIYALLTVPRGQKPAGGWPVVIFNHGYIPPEQYRTTERYVAYVAAFARNGYIVFRPDYRGHGESEGEAASNYASPAYTVDVLNAVAAMKQFPDANPDQIGMWGHSMGGGIALRVMVTTSDVKAGVIWAGTVAPYDELLERRWGSAGDSDNLLPTLEPNNGRWRWLPDMLEAYGSPEENPTFYASISPNTYLADLSGPIQLHHGTADTSVPVEYSEILAAQIQAAGKPVELFTYRGDNHNISANFAGAMARSIRFFDTYVKGVDSE